jgi:hypothetical protein
MRLLLQNILFCKHKSVSVRLQYMICPTFYYFSCSCGMSLVPLVSALRSQLYLLNYPLITY